MQFCEVEDTHYKWKRKGEAAATYPKKHKYPELWKQ